MSIPTPQGLNFPSGTSIKTWTKPNGVEHATAYGPGGAQVSWDIVNGQAVNPHATIKAAKGGKGHNISLPYPQ